MTLDVSALLREAEQKMKKSVEHFQHELTSIRTGRANPALIEDVMVSAYGGETDMQLKTMAQISAPEARLLLVQVYDRSQMGSVEKALRQAGHNPANDGQVIRVPIPPLTEERRREYSKLVRARAEEARVAIRNVRRDEIHRLQQAEKAGEVAADLSRSTSEKLQKVTDAQVQNVDTMAARKETEVMEV